MVFVELTRDGLVENLQWLAAALRRRALW